MNSKLTQSTGETFLRDAATRAVSARAMETLGDPDRGEGREDIPDRDSDDGHSEPPLNQSERLEANVAVGDQGGCSREAPEGFGDLPMSQLVAIQERVDRRRVGEDLSGLGVSMPSREPVRAPVRTPPSGPQRSVWSTTTPTTPTTGLADTLGLASTGSSGRRSLGRTRRCGSRCCGPRRGSASSRRGVRARARPSSSSRRRR